jgi:hypothetical protein
MRKIYSMPERHVSYVKKKAKKFQIAESDMLRRVIDYYKEQHEMRKKKD